MASNKLYFYLIVLSATALVPTVAYSYIDPNTTQTIVSSLGAVLAALGAGFVFVGAFLRMYTRKIFNLVRQIYSRPLLLGISITAVVMSFVLYFNFFHSNTGAPMKAESETSKVTPNKQMIILGIDGMDPKLTEEFMAQGKMPNFKKLAESGDFKPLMTVNPVQSPVVWATMATGVGPGTHGITDFITRKKNGYTPELSLVKQNENNLFSRPSAMFTPPVDPKLFFWESIAAEGIKAKVIRWPLTFPAKGSATVISGLGTPDLLGGMGTYTLFTTAPEHYPDDVKGTITKLEFSNGVAKTSINGPKKSGLTGVSTSTIPVTIKRKADEKSISIEIGSKTWDLNENDLSQWVPMSFPIGFGNKLTGMAQFLALEVDEHVHLYMSPIQIDPLNPAFPVASDTYGKDLAADIGRFHTLGMAEDTNALSDEIIDEDQFIKICDSIMDEAEQMFFRELGNSQTGLFSFVFDTLDRVQHMFWRFQDPEHPLYDETLKVKYGKVIEDHYRRMDRILGQLIEKTADRDPTILVVSDHGFTTYRRNFHVNTWLIEMGYMTLKPGHNESAGLFQSVDWSKTKAFALGFSQIFINVKGRDAQGVVDPKDVKALKEEITFNLSKVLDTSSNKSAVVRAYDTTEVYGIEAPLGPDLLVGMQPGYRFSWQTAIGAVPAFTFEDNDKRWSGDHCVDPEHVPGVVFSNRSLAVSHPSVVDIAPTALQYFGLEKMNGMAGQNLLKVQDRHASKNL